MIAGFTLVIESSTYEGSVAVFDGATLRSSRTLPASVGVARGTREEMLMPAVVAALDEAGVAVSGLARVITGAGPGSFTSLRIGGAIAKGLCHSTGIPLFEISSLHLIAAGAGLDAGQRCVAVLDAMRGEYHAREFERTESGIRPVGAAGIMTEQALDAIRSSGAAIVAGPRQRRDVMPLATHAVQLLDQTISGGPVDLATWEPTYGRLAEAQVKWEIAHGRPLAP